MSLYLLGNTRLHSCLPFRPFGAFSLRENTSIVWRGCDVSNDGAVFVRASLGGEEFVIIAMGGQWLRFIDSAGLGLQTYA